jgi:hypothetical protein
LHGVLHNSRVADASISGKSKTDIRRHGGT